VIINEFFSHVKDFLLERALGIVVAPHFRAGDEFPARASS